MNPPGAPGVTAGGNGHGGGNSIPWCAQRHATFVAGSTVGGKGRFHFPDTEWAAVNSSGARPPPCPPSVQRPRGRGWPGPLTPQEIHRDVSHATDRGPL